MAMNMTDQWDQWCALISPGASPVTPLSDVSDPFLGSPSMFATDEVADADDLGVGAYTDNYDHFTSSLDFSSPLPEPARETPTGGVSSGSYIKRRPGYDGYDGYDSYPTTRLSMKPIEFPPPATEQQRRAATARTIRTSRKPAQPTSKSSAEATRSSGSDDGPPPRPARRSHNQVEKKYRDRLNEQFEQLLAALAVVSSDQNGDGLDEDALRSPSKSAVLGLARRRLLMLERENRMLAAEVERLAGWLQRTGRA